jgi:SAM-dependent methyltransferase
MMATVPAFPERLHGLSVLDFGCGYGFQAIALAKRGICKSVVGVDIRNTEAARSNATRHGVADRVRFTESIAAERFDSVYSCSAFEHFADPKQILGLMLSSVKPGGEVIITFAEPWWSPYGSHFSGYSRLPWVNVLFSEATVMAVRSRYRSDGAKRYEDVEGGLNRMTLAKFERIMRNAPARIESMNVFPVRGLPLVTKIPLVREFLSTAASCVLRTS